MAMQINDRQLEERVLDAVIPICATFFSYDSNLCKNLIPELDAVEKQLNDRMEFYMISAIENPKMTGELRVEAVPTMILYREGAEIARYDGVHSSKTLIKQFIDILNKKK